MPMSHGSVQGMQPLTLNDVILQTNAPEAVVADDGVKVNYAVAGNTLAGTLPSLEGEEIKVVVSEEGEDGLAMEIEGGETYHFTVMDLPDANKESVYQRMISERNAIAAKYTADGNRQYLEKTAEVDAKVRQIKSDAEAEAAKTIAEGENEYYSILADAYSKSKDKTEFYDFWISLQALEKSLANGGTYVVDENSPLYEILNSKTTVTTPQSEN